MPECKATKADGVKFWKIFPLQSLNVSAHAAWLHPRHSRWPLHVSPLFSSLLLTGWGQKREKIKKVPPLSPPKKRNQPERGNQILNIHLIFIVLKVEKGQTGNKQEQLKKRAGEWRQAGGHPARFREFVKGIKKKQQCQRGQGERTGRDGRSERMRGG